MKYSSIQNSGDELLVGKGGAELPVLFWETQHMLNALRERWLSRCPPSPPRSPSPPHTHTHSHKCTDVCVVTLTWLPLPHLRKSNSPFSSWEKKISSSFPSRSHFNLSSCSLFRLFVSCLPFPFAHSPSDLRSRSPGFLRHLSLLSHPGDSTAPSSPRVPVWFWAPLLSRHCAISLPHDDNRIRAFSQYLGTSPWFSCL